MKLDVEKAVTDRYSQGATEVQPSLCCPVNYRADLLKLIPAEVVEKDYGCGDPSQYLRPGETVLDLGSGAGKICFIASQVVGAAGRVIGVDMNEEMLALARKHQPAFALAVGWDNVRFARGRIQDLALDLDLLDAELRDHPVISARGYLEMERLTTQLRRERPLIASGGIDAVVSNCVLNLVDPAAKEQLFHEIYRVLKPTGRAIISDIVCDQEVPADLQADPELWSGCIAGAFREDRFCEAFAACGFHGIRILKRDEIPWRVVRGIEFRGLTLEAFKGKEGPCVEQGQSVIYRGPFKEVLDDDGHRLIRGHRHAVCEKTFRLYGREPYSDHFFLIEAGTGESTRGTTSDKGETPAPCGPAGCC
jgi:SAM-dependent methyltransferase